MVVSTYNIAKLERIEKEIKILAKTPPPTLYQTVNGEVEIVKQYPYNYRRDSVIQKYVQRWAETQFTWSGVIKKETEEIRDPGISIDKIEYPNVKVPSSAYYASFAFPENLQKSYLAYLAKEWVPKDYYSSISPTVTLMEIKGLSPVSKIEVEGDERLFYSVKISGILQEYKATRPTGITRHWQREIILVSVPPPIKKPNEMANLYERFSYQWKRSGLQIYDIRGVDK